MCWVTDYRCKIDYVENERYQVGINIDYERAGEIYELVTREQGDIRVSLCNVKIDLMRSGHRSIGINLTVKLVRVLRVARVAHTYNHG